MKNTYIENIPYLLCSVFRCIMDFCVTVTKKLGKVFYWVSKI